MQYDVYIICLMFVFIYMYIYRPPENKRINMSDKIIERMNTSYAQLSTQKKKKTI